MCDVGSSPIRAMVTYNENAIKHKSK